MKPRDRVLIEAVRTLQNYETLFGDPKIVAACAGELQRTFLKYAIRSPRRLSSAEHAAMDQALREVARIACGPAIHADNYVEASAFIGIAAECALANGNQAQSADETQPGGDDLETDLAASIEEAEREIAAAVAATGKPALWKPGRNNGDSE